MSKPLIQSEIEKKIRDYITKSVKSSKFSPESLTKEEIIQNTKLSAEDVTQGLSSLSNSKGFGDNKQVIEEVPCNFKCWVPTGKEGDKYKKRLYEAKLAHYRLTLFSVIIYAIICTIVVITMVKEYVTLPQYLALLLGGILVIPSIVIAQAIANPCYLSWLKIKKISGYQWWILLFVLSAIAGVVLWIADVPLSTIGIPISILANIVSIVGVAVQLARKPTT